MVGPCGGERKVGVGRALRGSGAAGFRPHLNILYAVLGLSEPLSLNEAVVYALSRVIQCQRRQKSHLWTRVKI